MPLHIFTNPSYTSISLSPLPHPTPSPSPSPHPLLVLRLGVQCIQGGLHPQQPAGQRQQQAHHLVQVADEHAELVHLVGLAHRHHHVLHLGGGGTAGDELQGKGLMEAGVQFQHIKHFDLEVSFLCVRW